MSAGVLALRQQLELKCTAVKESLRYSSADGAIESVDSLGELHKAEIILADPKGQVQLLLVCKHHELGCGPQPSPSLPPPHASVRTKRRPSHGRCVWHVHFWARRTETIFPSSLAWQPFPIFEARHFNWFAPDMLHTMCTPKDLACEADSLHQVRLRQLSRAPSFELLIALSTHARLLANRYVRWQILRSQHYVNLRGSAACSDATSMRGSCAVLLDSDRTDYAQLGQMPPSPRALHELKDSTVPEFNADDEDKKIKEAWEPIRWTRRVVLATCAQQGASNLSANNWHVGRGLSIALGNAMHAGKKAGSPEQRVGEHLKAYRQVFASLGECTDHLRTTVTLLEAAVEAQTFEQASTATWKSG